MNRRSLLKRSGCAFVPITGLADHKVLAITNYEDRIIVATDGGVFELYMDKKDIYRHRPIKPFTDNTPSRARNAEKYQNHGALGIGSS